MKRIRIQLNRQSIAEVGLADSYFLRLRGLIGRDPSKLGGLLIRPCGQIHTFFMSVPIDAVYLDRNGTVLQTDEGIPPARFCKAVRGARSVLELPARSAAGCGLVPGVQLQIERV